MADVWGERWEGTAAELLTAITPERPSKGWPTTARSLGGHLRRITPALRTVGVEMVFGRLAGGKRSRIIRIEKRGDRPSQPFHASQNTIGMGEDDTLKGTIGDCRDDRDDQSSSISESSVERYQGGYDSLGIVPSWKSKSRKYRIAQIEQEKRVPRMNDCTLTSIEAMIDYSDMKNMKPSQQLQQIIQNCGMSRYELSKVSGVDQGVLSRFVASNRGMTTDTLDKLAPALGLKITAQSKRFHKSKTKGKVNP